MAKYSIKRLTDEEMQAFMAQYPEAPPPDGFWELKSDDIRMGFYRTRVAAETAQKDLQLWETITGDFDDWVDETAKYHQMLPSEVETIIRGHL